MKMNSFLKLSIENNHNPNYNTYNIKEMNKVLNLRL